LGIELQEKAQQHNGKIDESSIETNDFMISSFSKLTLQSDIYAIGAILFRLLLDSPPPKEVTEDISEQKLQKETPEHNVFNSPYFCKDFIMSNELC
jgi:serine/threonine protein kinase